MPIIKLCAPGTDGYFLGKCVRLEFGVFKGEQLEKIFLTNPQYIRWLKSIEPSPTLKNACDHARLLESEFNRRPIIERCSADGCRRTAIRFLLTTGKSEVLFLCDVHCAASVGRDEFHSEYCHSYGDALKHAPDTPDGRKVIKRLISQIARGKGMQLPASNVAIARFFHERTFEVEEELKKIAPIPSARGLPGKDL